MPAFLVIARLTIHEARRRQLLRVLAVLTIVSVGLTAWGVDGLVREARSGGTEELFIQLGSSQILIFAAFMFSFVLAMTAAFLGAPAIAADIESGIALALLARPVRRADIVVGRWLGLAAVIVAYAGVSGLLEIWAVSLVTGYLPPRPWLAVGFLAFESLIMLTLALLLSTRLSAIAAGAVTVVAFGLTWILGVIGGVARALEADAFAQLVNLARSALPTDSLWRGVVYGLQPPLSVLVETGELRTAMAANPFHATSPPPLPLILYAAGWLVVVIAASIWLLQRREI